MYHTFPTITQSMCKLKLSFYLINVPKTQQAFNNLNSITSVQPQMKQMSFDSQSNQNADILKVL